MKKALFTVTTLLSIFLVSSCSKGSGGETPEKPDDFGSTEIDKNSDYNKLFPNNAVGEGTLFVNQLLLLEYKIDGTALYSDSEFQDLYTKKVTLPKGSVSIKDWTANSPELFQKKTDIKKKALSFFDEKVKDIINLRKALISSGEQKAEKGVSGYISAVDEHGASVGKKRFVDGKGIELSEVLKKQEMGIILLDQIVNHHLSEQIMKDGNLRKANTDRVFMKDKKYTELEYHWDIAYTLLGTSSKKKNRFLANYLINEYHGAGDNLFAKVYFAFKIGREALAKSDYNTVEASIGTIRESLSKLFAGRAIYYLQQGMANINGNEGERTEAFHNLSETYGFIASFIVTRKADGSYYVNDYKIIEDLLKDFEGQAGLWDTERLLKDENEQGSLKNIIKRIKEIYNLH